MNFSISFLSLQKLRNSSPFFFQTKNQNFLIRNSKIQRSFTTFLCSNSKSSDFKNVHFSKFLDTVIIVNSQKELKNAAYSSRINIEQEDSISIDSCSFSDCSSPKHRGGALEIHKGRVLIIRTTFSKNSAKSSGTMEIRDSSHINITLCSIDGSSARRFGVGMIDGRNEQDSSFLSDVNFTKNRAEKSVGAIRLQHGSGMLSMCNFHNNTAPFSGCVLTFTNRPSFRSFSYCSFRNNEAKEHSAAIAIFLLGFFGQASDSVFIGNEDGSILVKSDSCSFDISYCVFSGSKDKEITLQFPTCQLTLDQRSKFNVTSI